VCPDVSGSMESPVTGAQGSATSAVRCIDVAALVAASIVRRNPSAKVLPFEDHVVDVQLDPRDSIMANAEKLASVGGGGTSCSKPLLRLNQQMAYGDLVIFISDNESWADPQHGQGTEMMRHWERFKRRNPDARLVCIDIQPSGTTQAQSREDVLNVGGFSDAVFTLIAEFAAGRLAAGQWSKIIDDVAIAQPAVA
jgi:60 kDa SS-A/Ro ribonucleoprotein